MLAELENDSAVDMRKMDEMDILCLSPNYWDDLTGAFHQVMTRLAENRRVLLVSPQFWVMNIVGAFGRAKLPVSGLKQIKKNLFSFTPPKYLPYNYKFKKINTIIYRLMVANIRRKIKKLGLHDLVIYIWHPDQKDLIDEFYGIMVCYHICDEYSGYTKDPIKKKKIMDAERELLAKADLVITTSPGLFEKKKTLHPNVVLIPNGVDYDHYSQAAINTNLAIPEDLNSIPEPRIGYIGNVNDKVDFLLLQFIAESRPDWSIILIGPLNIHDLQLKANFEKVQTLNNVYFLGQKPVEVLPAYIKGLNVCMMCYLINDWTYYGYPLKMHEYLAGGKPVVSSDLPAVREFSPPVAIAKTPQEWIKNIEYFISEKDEESKGIRMEIARKNTWDIRVEKIEEEMRRTWEEKCIKVIQ